MSHHNADHYNNYWDKLIASKTPQNSEQKALQQGKQANNGRQSNTVWNIQCQGAPT